jgi:hypothetical protein
MKKLIFAITLLAGSVATLSASTVCPSTPNTTSDCNYLITISSSGTASVSAVAGSSAFNGPLTFVDGTTDPGNDGSLVGVINNDSQALTSFTLTGAGAGYGIFDFTYNGICVYTGAAYCTNAVTGFEGPTTTFSNLQSTVPFETTMGTVTFNPTLMTGSSTYFAIEDAPADINANGGLSVSDVMLAPGMTAAPEPANIALLAVGIGLFLVFRKRLVRS